MESRESVVFYAINSSLPFVILIWGFGGLLQPETVVKRPRRCTYGNPLFFIKFTQVLGYLSAPLWLQHFLFFPLPYMILPFLPSSCFHLETNCKQRIGNWRVRPLAVHWEHAKCTVRLPFLLPWHLFLPMFEECKTGILKVKVQGADVCNICLDCQVTVMGLRVCFQVHPLCAPPWWSTCVFPMPGKAIRLLECEASAFPPAPASCSAFKSLSETSWPSFPRRVFICGSIILNRCHFLKETEKCLLGHISIGEIGDLDQLKST